MGYIDMNVGNKTRIAPTRGGMRVTHEQDGVRTSVSPNGVGMSIQTGNGIRITKPIRGKTRMSFKVGGMKISM